MGLDRKRHWIGRGRQAALLALGASVVAVAGAAYAQTGGQTPVDLANPLVGTAPLDNQKLIGNAPPPGEPVYSGQTSPGARLPHSSVEAAPINPLYGNSLFVAELAEAIAPAFDDFAAEFAIRSATMVTAGSTAAAMLGRASVSTVLIDPHPAYPPDFRVEKLAGAEQVGRFRRTGLAEAVLRKATQGGENWIARFGTLLDKVPGEQFGIAYDVLVNAIRAEIPDGVERIVAKAVSVATSNDRQRVTLSNDEVISARLVVLANGLNVGLRQMLGIERQIISRCHSISIGFDVEPVGRRAFDFPALTYFSEGPNDRVPYLSLFAIGTRMRANLFTYREIGALTNKVARGLAATHKVNAPEGKINVTINSDEHGPLEVFVNVGKAGSDIAALAEALGRLISLNLRVLSPLSQVDRAKEIAEQLRGIGGSRSVGFGAQQIRSLPDAVARALELHMASLEDQAQRAESAPESNGYTNGNGHNGNGHGQHHEEDSPAQEVNPLALSKLTVTGNLCPECGCNTMVYEEGCKKCYSCGHSEC